MQTTHPIQLKPTAMTPGTPNEPSGSWDSIHVFETAERGRQAHYKLTSTVMLQLTTRRGGEGEDEVQGPADKKVGGSRDGWKREGEVSLSGSMTRQVRPSLLLAMVASCIHQDHG